MSTGAGTAHAGGRRPAPHRQPAPAPLCASRRAQHQAAGGATYKNDFKLPHTEAEEVAKLLTGAGLAKQNGAVGTVDLSEKHGMWYRWSHLIERRPILPALGALVLLATPFFGIRLGALVLLATPFFGIRLGNSDQGNDPSSTTTRKGYDLVAQGFGPGYNGKLELVVSGPKAADPAFLKTVTQTLAAQPGVVGASIQEQPLPGGRLTFVGFTPTTSPQDQKPTDLVKDLRSSILPPIVRGGPTHAYDYGITAIQVDFANVLQAKMPIFFLAVVGLSFLLLMVAFLSIAIPLTAAVMNLTRPVPRSA